MTRPDAQKPRAARPAARSSRRGRAGRWGRLRVRTALRWHVALVLAGLAAVPLGLWFGGAQRTLMRCSFTAAFLLFAAAFLLNGALGLTHGKMHLQLGSVVTRQSRGETMFKRDIAVQFACAALFLALAAWFVAHVFWR